MCSITGAFFPKEITYREERQMTNKLIETIIHAEDRGRDSFGIDILSWVDSPKSIRVIGPPCEHLGEIDAFLKRSEMSIVINNNRAEPTTEYVAQKRLSDVQPFHSGGWSVAHNGTIANDVTLCKDFDLIRNTSIDSAVIPALLEKFMDNKVFDPEGIVGLLSSSLIGSYSMAIAHVAHPEELLLMTNYKPLFLARHIKHGGFIFTSLEEYFGNNSVADSLQSEWRVTQIPAYTAVYLAPNTLREIPLSPPRKVTMGNPKKALVVCSGGLDSTVVAAKAIADGYLVKLLHFKYKCRAESQEVIAVKRIASALGVEVIFVETDIFKEVIKGSPLTGTGDETIADGVAGAEFAHEWVPARNMIMLSIATGIAEARGIDVIMLGNNLEEAGAYPDNEMIFIHKMNEVLPYAVQVNKRVRFEMPVGNLMKHEIVKLGLELDAPLDLCWSCYEAGIVHCGECGPCFMRRTAFRINGQEDMIPYANETHLCDSCTYSQPTCPSEWIKIEYGTGIGKDNVIQCEDHNPKGAVK